MSKADHYKILGVNPLASVDEIKKAYKRIAMESHPDRKPGDKKSEVRFQEAKDSYEVLSDPLKRVQYDQVVLNRLVDDPFRAAESAWNVFIDRTLQSSS